MGDSGKWTLLGLLLAAVAVPAPATRLPVRVFTTADGLGRNNVFCAVPDSKGFLWFCTSDGLSRYDGYQFVTYGTAQGLAHRAANAAIETRSGVYLAATERGVSRLDPAAPASSPRRFVSIPMEGGGAAAGVFALLEDRAGVVWCATNGGLYRIEHGIGAKSALRFVDSGVRPGWNVTALAEDRHGGLWIGSGVGLYRRYVDGRVEQFPSGSAAWDVGALMVDRNGDLWVARREGAWKVSIDSAGAAHVERHYGAAEGVTGVARSLLQSSDGSVWVGSSDGLHHIAADGVHSYGANEGLSGRAVLSLAEDRQGNLWAGMDHGLSRIAGQGFATFTDSEGIGTLPVRQIGENRGQLFAVTSQNAAVGLYRFAAGRFEAVLPRYPAWIRTFGWGSDQIVLHAQSGEWWVAAGDALCRFPRADSLQQLAGAAPLATYGKRDGFNSPDFFRLFEDSRGGIWVTALGSLLARWDPRTERFERFPAGDCPGFASAYAEDRAGNVWIGYSNDISTSRPSGVVRYRDGRFQQFRDEKWPQMGWIRDLLVDRAGRLWVASTECGVSRVDQPSSAQPRLARVPTVQPLASSTVYCLTEDHAGRIYAGTARGIDRIEPASGTVRHYTEADGLPAAAEALYCGRDGKIWAGTSMGLAVLDAAPDRPAAAPRIFITGLAVNGESRAIAEPGVEQLPQLRLQPDQRQLRVEFVSTGAAPGETVQYQYRLVGADADWSAPIPQRSVSYGGLASGRFRFLVRAVASGGSVSAVPAEVGFEVLPPFWQRWWFLAPAVLLLCALAWFGHRYDLARRVELERVRLRIARDLHDDLGASLSRVAILTELVNRRTDGGEAENSRTLTEIAEIARGMVDGLGDLVWSIDPRRDDLPSLLRRIRGYASDLLERQAIAWEFATPPEEMAMPILPHQRRHLLLIFQEAIRNAARHAGCSRVWLALEIAENEWLARIRDNGCGLPPVIPDSGNGLRNLRHRAAELGGSLEVHSEAGEGTEIRVRFPVARGHAGRIRMLFRGQSEKGVNRS